MVTQEQIQQLVNEIAEGYQPEKIYLFGSYANGKPTKDSDIDLFIIKETTEKWNDRHIQARAAVKNYPYVGMDIIIYTPKEFTEAQSKFLNIGKIAATTGKLMYERV
jgi:uncharacterized protein